MTGFLAWDLPRAGNAKYLRFSLNCANQLLANLTSSLVIRQFPTLILVAEGVWVFWGWYVQRPHYLLTAWSDQFSNLNWIEVQEDRSYKMLTSLNLCWIPWHIVTSNKGRLISKGAFHITETVSKEPNKRQQHFIWKAPLVHLSASTWIVCHHVRATCLSPELLLPC